MRKYFVLKLELKKLAKEIRLWKSRRKEGKREGHALSNIDYKVRSLAFDFRHNHIAYCELRGRRREQIEQPAPNNKPEEDIIESIKEHYSDETLCVSS